MADQELTSGATGPAATTAYSEAQAQAMAQAQERERQKVESAVTGMSKQVSQLMEAWAPPTMKHVKGDASKDDDGKGAAPTTASGTGGAATDKGAAGPADIKPPLIKAGTIMFAVLDTTVNSDYPDSPFWPRLWKANTKVPSCWASSRSVKVCQVRWIELC